MRLPRFARNDCLSDRRLLRFARNDWCGIKEIATAVKYTASQWLDGINEIATLRSQWLDGVKGIKKGAEEQDKNKIIEISTLFSFICS